jgi:hypothetical protein
MYRLFWGQGILLVQMITCTEHDHPDDGAKQNVLPSPLSDDAFVASRP